MSFITVCIFIAIFVYLRQFNMFACLTNFAAFWIWRGIFWVWYGIKLFFFKVFRLKGKPIKSWDNR